MVDKSLIKTTLPDLFHITNEEGDPVAVSEPVYRCSGDVFLGDNLWLEGEVIITRVIPNESMVPLNKAAEIAMAEWQMSLPVQGKGLRLEDIVEASMMMRPRDGEKELTHEEHSNAVMRLAASIKEKREGGRPLVGLPTGVRSGAASKVAPMANANFTDQTRNAYGHPQAGPVNSAQPARQQSPVRKVGAPPAGNMPPNSQPAR